MRRSTALLLVLLVAAGSAQFQPASLPDWSGHTVREELARAAPLDGAQRVLRFVHVSDVHIIDDDAPAPMRVGAADEVFYDTGVSDGAQRPQEEYSDELLDSLIRSINALHAEEPFDFVINTGDSIDNELENELMRFIDAWEGRVSTRGPISGLACVPDGQSTDVDDEAHDVTESCTSLPPTLVGNQTALAPGLPWFTAFGNHDGLIQGNVAVQPSFDELAEQFGRYFVRQSEYVAMHFDDDTACDGGVPRSSPQNDYGHGFGFAADRLCDDDGDNDGYYTFATRGVRFVVLDTINDDPSTLSRNMPPQIDPDATIGYDPVGGLNLGAIDPAQFDWMLDEIDAAGDELVIVTSHHTLNSMLDTYYEQRCGGPCPGIPNEAGTVGSDEIMAELAQRPNVVAWLGGHVHEHKIEAKAIEGAPSPGFWNIETSSIIDLPQEARIIEVWLTADGAKGFFATAQFTHDYEAGRVLAATDDQFDGEKAAGLAEDRDVLLWFDVPPGVQLTPQDQLPRFLALQMITPERLDGRHGIAGAPVSITLAARSSVLDVPVDDLHIAIDVVRGDSDAGQVTSANGTMMGSGNGTYTFSFTPDAGRVHFVQISAEDPSGNYPPTSRQYSLDIGEAPAVESGKKSPGIGPVALLVLVALLGRRR